MRKWLTTPAKEIFWAPVMFNIKMFFYCIHHLLAKKNNYSPEEIELKLVMTNFTDEKSIIVENDYFYINGFVIENAIYNKEKMMLDITEVDNNDTTVLPYIGITYKLVDLEHLEEKLIDKGFINVPIYNKNIQDDFENMDPLTYICLQYNHEVKDEDYWIIKGVKIFLDH